MSNSRSLTMPVSGGYYHTSVRPNSVVPTFENAFHSLVATVLEMRELALDRTQYIRDNCIAMALTLTIMAIPVGLVLTSSAPASYAPAASAPVAQAFYPH